MLYSLQAIKHGTIHQAYYRICTELVHLDFSAKRNLIPFIIKLYPQFRSTLYKCCMLYNNKGISGKWQKRATKTFEVFVALSLSLSLPISYICQFTLFFHKAIMSIFMFNNALQSECGNSNTNWLNCSTQKLFNLPFYACFSVEQNVCTIAHIVCQIKIHTVANFPTHE